ncbi:MAG: Hsp20/alpha crystallin family protein [Sediminibacterium sp.]|nr:Hsp20/alpha crystallin family protein [Sediminibacterium sp.]
MALLKNNSTSVFDELFNNFPATWGRDVQTGYPSASVNIHETSDAFHLELNAPGRDKADFKINVNNGLLTISYEKKEETEQKDYKTIRREFSYRSFKRSFTIDETIHADAIEARYENGVLKLLLPKKEEVKLSPKEISIQ